MDSITNWLAQPETDKAAIFKHVADNLGISSASVEKDWWVTHALAVVFSTEIEPFTVFKGGTSLSKAWNLIERFSEDIDLALDRNFLGFDKEMTITQVKKLRKRSYEYISEVFYPMLQQQFEEMGLDVKIEVENVKDTDKDPLIIQVLYTSVVDNSAYILPKVLIEIGSRSLKEPFSNRKICSYVGEQYKGRPFADLPLTIPCVNPERTFLEKIFLLHEEFQKPVETIRINRMSRHLYDLGKLADSPFAAIALADDLELYTTIVAHRQLMTPLRGIDYNKHQPAYINPIPPKSLMTNWQKDYEAMQTTMIYGESLPFDMLIEKLRSLTQTINNIAN